MLADVAYLALTVASFPLSRLIRPSYVFRIGCCTTAVVLRVQAQVVVVVAVVQYCGSNAARMVEVAFSCLEKCSLVSARNLDLIYVRYLVCIQTAQPHASSMLQASNSIMLGVRAQH